jgi:hypothetical protein
MKSASAAFPVALALALSGCVGAPAVKISKNDLERVRTIRILPSVQMPAEMFFHGKAQSCAIAVGSGALGAAACPKASKEPKEEILDTMKAHDIWLADIVRTEFQKTVTSRGLFTVAADAQVADAELILAVNVYGLGQTQGFSSLLYPVLNVSATLRKPDGTVAWQNTDFVTPQNAANTGGHEFQQYLQNPELLRDTWMNVAQIVSGMLVDDLAKSR